MGRPSSSAASGITRISKRVVLSYVIDWVFIVGVALIGYAFYKQTPNQHPFSLHDPGISYPYTQNETVTTEVLVLVSLVAPAAIIVIGSILLTPGTAAPDGVGPTTAQIIRKKFWEWNAGWLGLGVAYAGVFMATQGLKVLVGRPRPDLLARCDPDTSQIDNFAVSGLGTTLPGAPTMVCYKICRQQTSTLTVEGFSSFPSGHSSSSFAGLGYLTLWLCAKFSVGFPYLPSYPVEGDEYDDDSTVVRRRGAAPPVMLMVFAFVPTCTAFFIAASRWFNYRHHAFDIIFGGLMGAFFAWVGFNMYHLPLSRGAGWSWGPRTGNRAFFRTFGFPSSVGTDSWTYVPKDMRTTDYMKNMPSIKTQSVHTHTRNESWPQPQITVENGDGHITYPPIPTQESWYGRHRAPRSPRSPVRRSPSTRSPVRRSPPPRSPVSPLSEGHSDRPLSDPPSLP